MRRPAASHHQPQDEFALDDSHWLVQKGIVLYSPAPGYALSSKGPIPPLSHSMPDSPDGTMELTVVGNATNYDSYAISLPGSTPFTLIAWGKVVDTTNDHILFGVGIAGQNEQRAVISMDGADGGGSDRCYAFCKDGTAADQVFTSVGAYTANKWHMVTGVFGSATDMRIYRDGGLEGAQVSGVNIPTSAMTRAYVGSVPAVSPQSLRNGDRVSGCICVLGALTAAEVSRLYYEQLENPWSLLGKRGRRFAQGVGSGAALSGSAAAQSAATGALTTGIPLAGASASVATASGNLTTDIPLAGSAASVSLAGGVLTTQINLAADALAVAAASGALTTQITLSGAALAQALATADLTTSPQGLEGNAAASATGSATLTTEIPLAGAASAFAVASGGLITGIPLAGVAASVASATGNLTISITLSADAMAQAAASGSLSTQIQLSASALAQALGTADFAFTGLVLKRLMLQSPVTMRADLSSRITQRVALLSMI